MVLYWAPERQWFADFVARYPAILNSSINFLIYCLVGTNFRTSLMRSMGYPNNTTNDISTSTAAVSSSPNAGYRDRAGCRAQGKAMTVRVNEVELLELMDRAVL